MARGGEEDLEDLLFGEDNSGLIKTVPRDQRSSGLSREEWIEAEQLYVDTVIEEIQEKIQEAASSPDKWRAFLRGAVLAPEYSLQNVLWARMQLRHRGVEEPGLILSESQWARLGRRVREEYADPSGRASAKRDRRFGYDPGRDWDPKYSAEMMRPLGRTGFWKTTTTGGVEEKTWVPLPVTRFTTFRAYHQDATEAIDGGTPEPLPEPEIENGDAAGAIRRDLIRAGFEARDDTEAQEALRVAALSFLPTDVPDKIRDLAADSATYILASFYDLEIPEQKFAGLSALNQEELQKVQSLSLHCIQVIGPQIHPRLNKTLEERGEQIASRAAKRARQAS